MGKCDFQSLIPCGDMYPEKYTFPHKCVLFRVHIPTGYSARIWHILVSLKCVIFVHYNLWGYVPGLVHDLCKSCTFPGTYPHRLYVIKVTFCHFCDIYPVGICTWKSTLFGEIVYISRYISPQDICHLKWHFPGENMSFSPVNTGEMPISQEIGYLALFRAKCGS